MGDDVRRSRMTDEDEDDEDDVRPRRPRRAVDWRPKLRLVGVVAWAGLLAATALGGLLFVVAVAASKSAPQEAAAGAIFSTFFIGTYVFVRCVEKLIAGYERIHAKESSNGR